MPNIADPSVDFFAKVHSVLDRRLVKLGKMTDPQIALCSRGIEHLSKRQIIHKEQDDLELAERLLERLEMEADRQQRKILEDRNYIHLIRGWGNTGTEQGGQRALKVFYRRQALDEEDASSLHNPHLLHALLLALTNCRGVAQARQVADALMRASETACLEQTPPRFLPNHVYNAMIMLHASRADTEYGAAASAEDWIHHMASLAMEYDGGGGDGSGDNNNIINNNNNSNGNGSSNGNQNKNESDTITEPPSLTTDTFDRVLRAWVNSPERGSMARAEEILNLLLKHARTGDQAVQPDPSTFGTLISAYARQGQPLEAQRLFDLAVEHFTTPTSVLSSQTMPEEDETDREEDNNAADEESKMATDSTKKPTEVDDSDEAVLENVLQLDEKEFLQSLNQSQQASPFSGVVHDKPHHELSSNSESKTAGKKDLTPCFNATLFAWVNMTNYNNNSASNDTHHDPSTMASAVMKLFRRLPELEDSNVVIDPDKASYESLIHMLIHSGRLQEAEEILQKMIQAYRAAGHGNAPTPATGLFYKVMNAIASKQHREEGNPIAEHVTNLLEQLLELYSMNKKNCFHPDPILFHICIKCHCVEGNSAKAVSILQMAESRWVSNPYMYLDVINALTPNSPDPKLKQGGSSIDNHHDNTYEAVRLLQRMEQRVLKFGQPLERNFTGLYTRVISSLANLRTLHAAQTACALMTGLTTRLGEANRHIQPSTRMYTAVMNAFSKTEDGDNPSAAAEHALNLFREIVELDGDRSSRIHLDETGFFTILRILASAGHVEMATRAREILAYMSHLHAHENRKELQPTTRCLDACIRALLNSQQPGEAAQLLQSLSQKGLATDNSYSVDHFPSKASFRNVSRACRQSRRAELIQAAKDLDGTAASIFQYETR